MTTIVRDLSRLAPEANGIGIGITANSTAIVNITVANAVSVLAPAIIVTPKGIVHEIEAKSDNCVLACIHAIRNGDGLDDIAPQEITPEEARALIEKYPLVESIKNIFGN